MAVARPCKVGVLSGESGLSTLQETTRRICKAKRVTRGEMANFVISTWLPRLGDSKAKHTREALETLEQMVVEAGCEVLIIDPAYLCMPGNDAGNLMVQGERLALLSEVCQKHGVTLVLLHHTRKRRKGDNTFEPFELDDLSWAGFAEFARQWFLIGRRGVYEPGTGQHKLWLSIGGSAGHSALWAVDIDEGTRPRHWRVELSTPSEARDEKRGGTIRQKIIDAARNFPGGETKSVIFQAVNLKHRADTNAVFDAMVEEGVLVPVPVKKIGREYEGFRLNDNLVRVQQ